MRATARLSVAMCVLVFGLSSTIALAQKDAYTHDLTGDWKDAQGRPTGITQYVDDKQQPPTRLTIRSADCADALSDKCVEFQGWVEGSTVHGEHLITAGTLPAFFGQLSPQVRQAVLASKAVATLDGSVSSTADRIDARLTIPQFDFDTKSASLKPRPPKVLRTSLSAKARIIVRDPRDTSGASNASLAAVTTDQPFFVDLRMPRVDAAKIGPMLEVEFRVVDTGSTTHLRLGSDNSSIRGAMVYTTDEAVSIEGGGKGAGNTGTGANFAASFGGHIRGVFPGNMFGLKVPEGGEVTISYKDGNTPVSTTLKVYSSHTRQALGLCQDSIDALYSLYGRALSQLAAQLTEPGRKALRSKMKAIENERRMVAFEPKESDRFFFADTTRLKICEGYFRYVLTDPAKWNEGDPRAYSGGGNGFTGPDGRFPGVSYEAWQESQIAGFAIPEGERMWKDAAIKSWAALTINLYQVVIGLTLADQLWIAAIGTNPVTGEQEDLTARVFAGVGFASGVTVGVLGGRALQDRNRTNLLAEERPAPGKWMPEANLDGTTARGLAEGSPIKELQDNPKIKPLRDGNYFSPAPERGITETAIAKELPNEATRGPAPPASEAPKVAAADSASRDAGLSPPERGPGSGLPASEPTAEPKPPTTDTAGSSEPKPGATSGGFASDVDKTGREMAKSSEPPASPPKVTEPPPGTEPPKPATPTEPSEPLRSPETVESERGGASTRSDGPQSPTPQPPREYTTATRPESGPVAPGTDPPRSATPTPPPREYTTATRPEPGPGAPGSDPPRSATPTPPPREYTTATRPEPGPVAGGSPPMAAEPRSGGPLVVPDTEAQTKVASVQEQPETLLARPGVDPPAAAGPAAQPGRQPAAGGPTSPPPPIRGPPRSSPEKPLTGRDITTTVSAEYEAATAARRGDPAPSAASLTGETVNLGESANGNQWNSLKIGEKRGIGVFGGFYEIEENARGVKIIYNETEGPKSVPRQVYGFDLIKNDPQIPAPRIFDYSVGKEGNPPFLIVEDLEKGRWKDLKVQFRSNPSELSEAELKAASELYKHLTDRGLIPADAKTNNLFWFTDENGKTRAGILDHDMIFRANELEYKDMLGVQLDYYLDYLDGRATRALPKEIRAQSQFYRDAYLDMKKSGTLDPKMVNAGLFFRKFVGPRAEKLGLNPAVIMNDLGTF